MRNPSKTVEPEKAAARTVITIHIDIGQLIAAVRRHVPITSKAAFAIRNDLATLFSATRVAVMSSALTRKAIAAGDRATKSPPRPTQ